MFKLMQHTGNQHGFSVSLTKYLNKDDPFSLEKGFVLNSLPSKQEQDKYINDLSAMTGYEIEKDFSNV